jgi:predicted ArsR family transcriptional regulator
MDWACRSLVEILKVENDLSLNQIVQKSGFARQTVHNHLKHLVKAGFLSCETVKRGRGRPTIIYHRFKQRVEVVEDADVVWLTFQKLKRACRFEKGEWCKKLRNQCTPEKCPLTMRGK